MGTDDFRRLTIVDTALASTNVGDEIIMDAVNREVADLFADARHYRVASHENMAAKSRKLIRDSDFALLGGTNMLSSHAAFRSVWKLSPADLALGAKFVSMGCGWYHDEGGADPLTRLFYRSLLSKSHLHAVRDEFTRKRLMGLGLENVINTGCPTLWRLQPDHLSKIPQSKADAVVTTLNTYMPDRDADRRLLELLARSYKTVYAWVQTSEDHDYLKALLPEVVIVPPNLAAYDGLLARDMPLDYVGNRLHGGIRALQHGRRSIIIEIDNRAREMGGDFNLPTVPRTGFERLEAMIHEGFDLSITLPVEAIEAWRSQWKPTAGQTS